MSTAVVHFENIEKVAKEFRKLLENKGLEFKARSSLDWKFVDYLSNDPAATPNRRAHAEVAQEASDWITNVGDAKRLVVITDLQPELSNAPKYRKYGLDVLADFARAIGEDHNHPPFIFNVDDLVSSQDIMVFFLTAYGTDCRSGLCTHPSWKKVEVRIVGPHDDAQDIRLTVPQTLRQIQEKGPRVVYADRSTDGEWASDLVARWIRQGDE